MNFWPFNSKSGAGLVCPRCEKSLEGHDEAACVRRMSRRYFFGAMAGGAVLAATGPELAKAATTELILRQFNIQDVNRWDIAYGYAAVRPQYTVVVLR